VEFSVHLKADTLDDLMRGVLQRLVASTDWVTASRGRFTEEVGAVLHLTNPRSRLSRSETRGKAFSPLGEWLWYLSGANDYAFVEYYVPTGYRDDAPDRTTVPNGYGERLANLRGHNQLANIIKLLEHKRTSRQAVIQLFDAGDVGRGYGVPCTCTLQFLVRNDRVHMVVNMRSNDAYLGLPHDVFAFTMLQELVARAIGADVGEYTHCVGSLHLYDERHDKAKAFVGEAFQGTVPMPAMPEGEPWSAIRELRRAERILREGGQYSLASASLDPYWEDLVRLLMAYRADKNKDIAALRTLRGEMNSTTYRVFIDARVDNLEDASRAA
jgi:thymidylate synthase